MNIGDVVTIILPNSSFQGIQGEVVRLFSRKHPDGPIGIKFGAHCPSYLFAPSQNTEQIVRFHASELRLDPEGWSIENRAIRVFGKDRCHTIYVPQHPLDREANCMVTGCQSYCHERIIFNVHGSVCSADVCALDAIKYGNTCRDSFPWQPTAASKTSS